MPGMRSSASQRAARVSLVLSHDHDAPMMKKGRDHADHHHDQTEMVEDLLWSSSFLSCGDVVDNLLMMS